MSDVTNTLTRGHITGRQIASRNLPTSVHDHIIDEFRFHGKKNFYHWKEPAGDEVTGPGGQSSHADVRDLNGFNIVIAMGRSQGFDIVPESARWAWKQCTGSDSDI